MLVHSVLKSNQIAQQVISDGAKTKQNGGNQVFIYLFGFKTKITTNNNNSNHQIFKTNTNFH